MFLEKLIYKFSEQSDLKVWLNLLNTEFKVAGKALIKYDVLQLHKKFIVIALV